MENNNKKGQMGHQADAGKKGQHAGSETKHGSAASETKHGSAVSTHEEAGHKGGAKAPHGKSEE